MSPIFDSFFLGGFEASCHRRHDRTQLDLIAGSGHAAHVTEDYKLLRSVGIRAVRDGLRWHLIEQAPERYDWSSFLPMLHAADSVGTQVIWDLCHWGLPHDIDIFAPEFVTRFARFAAAAAQVVRDETGTVPFYAPVNEISFWSWIGGDKRNFYPYATKRGGELKEQLVRASVEAIRAIRDVEPRARFMQPEPIIHIVPNPKRPHDDCDIEGYNRAQYEAWDMLTGRLKPELGGDPSCVDIVGVNYYWQNQWIHKGGTIPIGHYRYKPLSVMLEEVYERYRRPVLIAETGAEGASAQGWLHSVCGDVHRARQRGVPIEGICIYPVADYPGWEDNRHCEVGLIESSRDWQTHRLRPELVEQLEEETAFIFRETLQAV